ncbi:MAG: hypothetical protein FWC76_08335 [Defluviitaleaceae bacterium]|nr:hypothetical protein [Defluviitaleaceae bacterium]
MKKLLAIFMIVAAMMLASCNIAPEAHTTPIRGFWDGDTFTSEYFGLRFNLPESWTVMTESELAALLPDRDVMPVPEGARIPQDVFEDLGQEAFFYDMIATSGSLFTTIQGTLMWIEWFPGDWPLSEASLLQGLAAEAQDVEEWEIIINEGITRIGTYYWHSAESRIYGADGHLVTALMFARVDGRFAKFIGISYHDIEAVDEFLNYFEAY